MRRASKVATLAVVAALPLVLGTILLGWAHGVIHDPPATWPSDPVTVDIDPGIDAVEILERLHRAGVVRDRRLARLYLIHALDDPYLQAGEYRFEAPLSTAEVLDKLTRGEVVTHPVTLVEGLTLEETAGVLAERGFGDRDRLVEIMSDPTLVADLDPDAEDLEGYLFPDTYAFARDTTEATVVAALVANFRRQARDLIRERPTDLRSLVTLASIVEKETRLDPERALVAGVYRNRLERRIPLAADPTIIFALKKAGSWDGNLRRPDLRLESPYNTYLHAGLPPGPICSPGRLSLEAAAAPAATSHLYFVSRNDGSHVFADTLAEHNRNVYRWQKQYWRKKWAEERRRGGS